MYYPPLAADLIGQVLTEESSPLYKWPPGLAPIVAAYAECKVTVTPYPDMNGYSARFSRKRDYMCYIINRTITVRNGTNTYTVATPGERYNITLDTEDTIWMISPQQPIMYLPYNATQVLPLLDAKTQPITLDLNPLASTVCSSNLIADLLKVLKVLPPSLQGFIPTLIFNVGTNLYRGPAGGPYTQVGLLPELTIYNSVQVSDNYIFINVIRQRKVVIYTLDGVYVHDHITETGLSQNMCVDLKDNLLRTTSSREVEIMATSLEGNTRTIYTHPNFLAIMGVTYDGSIIFLSKTPRDDVYMRLYFE